MDIGNKIVNLTDYRQKLSVSGGFNPAERRQMAHDIVAANLALTEDLRAMLFLHAFPVEQLVPGRSRFDRSAMDADAFQGDDLAVFGVYIDEKIVTRTVDRFLKQKIVRLKENQARILNEPASLCRSVIDAHLLPVLAISQEKAGELTRQAMCAPYVSSLYLEMMETLEDKWSGISSNWEAAFAPAPNWRKPLYAPLKVRVTAPLQEFAYFVYEAMVTDIGSCVLAMNAGSTTNEVVEHRKAWFRSVAERGDDRRFTLEHNYDKALQPRL